jgi:hypothetical protein
MPAATYASSYNLIGEKKKVPLPQKAMEPFLETILILLMKKIIDCCRGIFPQFRLRNGVPL